MNWLNKLEQKYGSKAIPNITRIFIAANLIGSVLLLTKGDVVLYYLQFSASAILHGQVWRLISWIFVPSGSISFLQLLFIFCLWTLGDSMESYLGSFRMNVYFFGGFLLYDIVGMLAFAVTHVSINLTMYYILIAMYLMLGLLMPEAEVRLYFVLPIKMKWMVLVYFVMFAYDVQTLYELWMADWIGIRLRNSTCTYKSVGIHLWLQAQAHHTVAEYAPEEEKGTV